MKIYFVGEPDRIVGLYKIRNLAGIKRWLISFVDIPEEPKQMMRLYEDLVNKYGLEIFLDSGAFSAFQLGAKINLEDYIWFIRRYGHIFKEVAALDVIGSGPKSLENYIHMYNSGIKRCIPAWHYKDEKMLIKKYLDYTDYIALGNLVGSALNRPLRAKTIRTGIDVVKEYNPNAKIHLYAVTTISLLRLFGAEIESVDSTSWLSGSKYAIVYNVNSTFDYQGRIRKGQGHNSFRINAYNARKFMEIEQLINERKQDDRDKSRLRITLQHN